MGSHKKASPKKGKEKAKAAKVFYEVVHQAVFSGKTFPCIAMGRAESVLVGDLVLAIGNNLGFHDTVTDDIISAIGRTDDARLPIAYPQFSLIQTNASIPGSSGGALVNMQGELIDINESIATSAGFHCKFTLNHGTHTHTQDVRGHQAVAGHRARVGRHLGHLVQH